jgi:renalase
MESYQIPAPQRPDTHAVISSCVVVGAGVCGLVAARSLADAGWRVVVLEEGSEVGGRIATRRVGEWTFDSGAQFFTTRSERFKRMVEEWLAAGIVGEWTRGFVDAEGIRRDDGYPRYRGLEGMASIARHLARGLDVHTGERAARADVRDGGWEVSTHRSARESGTALLLTAPVPGSLSLVDAGNLVLPVAARQRLETVSYAPCLALMALLDTPSGVPEPGGVQVKSEPLDWIADNQRKGISTAPGITVHAGPAWSRRHFEDSEAHITASLLAFASEHLHRDLSSTLLDTSLCRWRYSWVTRQDPEPCLLASENPPLIFAGDAFGEAKVEGAVLSGLAAAERLVGFQT